MLQRIRQVVEFTPVKQLLGHIVLQPQHLGDFHFNTHRPANIPQQVMFCVVYFLGLFDGAMVEP